MNRIRICLLTAVAVLVGFVAYGWLSRPAMQGADSPGFSAERVVKDLEVISRNHHSVAHPEERAEVRNYLVSRLGELGADTVRLFEYQALTGPEKKHVEYTFDATNVLATFAPEQPSEQPTYLLMVAHYDSRYSQPIGKNDTVWSYGAADDGYGVGVILESVKQALKYRADWKQGVKVLFTDAEEVGMMGMKAAWANDREIFDNVGFMINIEARGPWGPALLFETCPGNEKVMDLYAEAAKYPFTYSLTTVVYNFMPNFTDFTIVKDEVPGMNFSTIADINHYHTDLDNFSNVNAKSIQHYGSQVVPIVHEYLTNDKYTVLDCCLYSNYILAYVIETTDTQQLFKVLSIAPDGSELSEVATVMALERTMQKEPTVGGRFYVHRNRVLLTMWTKGEEKLVDMNRYGTAILNLDTKEVIYLDEEAMAADNPELTDVRGYGEYFYFCKLGGRKGKKIILYHRRKAYDLPSYGRMGYRPCMQEAECCSELHHYEHTSPGIRKRKYR